MYRIVAFCAAVMCSFLPTVVHGDTGTDRTELVAEAGLPFLAYVGDTVILDGSQSQGPDDVDLGYTWDQVAGPPMDLDDPTIDRPSFLVTDAGTLVFELTVDDGTNLSEPAWSQVIVFDRAAGLRHTSKGCSQLPVTGGLGWLMAWWIGMRRRTVTEIVEIDLRSNPS